MKKSIFLAMCASLLAFTACDKDEVAKKYQVSVTISSENVQDLQDISAIATSESGSETKGTVEGTTATFQLPAGSYTVSVSAKDDFFNYVGSTKLSVADKDVNAKVELIKSKPAGSIIFKEIYATGVKSYYWTDGFYELVNNTDEVQYLDGIIMGIVQNGYGEISSWADTLTGALPDYYPMGNHTVYFPGNGTDYPLQPGQSVVCATRAIDHSSRELGQGDVASPVDLSHADWDIFIPSSKQDTDNPDVPNMLVAYSQFGFDFMPATSGQSLILAKLPKGITVDEFVKNPDNLKKPEGVYMAALCIPAEYVIDAVDILYFNEDKNIFKSILDSDDAGYTYASEKDDEWADPMYSGKSIRRKCSKVENGRAYFMDTNNSSNDFIAGGQTPVLYRSFKTAD